MHLAARRQGGRPARLRASRTERRGFHRFWPTRAPLVAPFRTRPAGTFVPHEEDFHVDVSRVNFLLGHGWASLPKDPALGQSAPYHDNRFHRLLQKLSEAIPRHAIAESMDWKAPYKKTRGRQEPPLACAGFRPAKCASMHFLSRTARRPSGSGCCCRKFGTCRTDPCSTVRSLPESERGPGG